jgi:hypothetical protein
VVVIPKNTPTTGLGYCRKAGPAVSKRHGRFNPCSLNLFPSAARFGNRAGRTSGVRVLAARPLRIRESWTSELFGDYSPVTMPIRVWMGTTVRKEVTSFATLLSTLCHEFWHHLDFQKFGFPDSWHSRGFYERAGALYYCARGTVPKHLFWAPMAGVRWRINWPHTNRGG